MNDPASEVARIAAFLELDTSSSAVTSARAQLDDHAGLRHHRTTFGEASAAPGASFAAVAWYAVLQRVVALQRGGALRFEDLHDVAGPLAGRAARAHVTERNAAALSMQLAALDARAAALADSLEARAADVARARGEVTALTSRLHESTSDYARLAALLLEREAEAAARLSARDAEAAALLRAQEAEADARLSARNAEVAALLLDQEAAAAARLSASYAEMVALRSVHDADVAALRAAHDADLATVRTAHGTEVATLRASHDADVAAWQAQGAADAVTQAGLQSDVQRARAELNAAGTEVGRLNALLLHLQTPTGVVKLALRALLPPGLHQRLRSWAGWSGSGPAAR